MKTICITFALVFFLLPLSFSHIPPSDFSEICSPLISPREDVFQPILAQLAKDKPNRETGEANYRIRTVVIDPGHGGHDSGCSGAFSHEKDIVLQIALRLGNAIQANFPDIRVVYTRDRDVFIPLHKRARLANSQKADLFISIHCNNIPNANYVRGSETYVLGLHRAEDNLEVAKRENAAILLEDDYQTNYAGYDPNSAENHIIMAMFQNAFLGQSINFAEKVEQQIQQVAHGKSRGVKQAGFLVLRETTMPSVLIESGYLSNQTDDNYLTGEYGQQQMASAIFRAFSAYKAEIETDDGPLPTVTTAPPVQQRIVKAENRERIVPPAPTVVSQPVSIKGDPRSLIISSTPPISNTDYTPALPVEHPIIYKVQLASGTDMIDISQAPWKTLDHSVEVKQEGRIYKYLSTGFSDIQQAIQLRNELRQKGFKDAFVVAYRGQERVK